ncbi:MAG: shikimate dehydrogenase [Bacillota bacterium]
MAGNGQPRPVGLIGFPVRHSASPALHQAAFRALGLDWVYLLMEVEPALLGDAVRGLRALSFAGANVTIPHKRAVMAFLDELAPEAALTGAVNTICIEGLRLVGHNTDVGGFARAVNAAGIDLRGARVLVLGAGGAARAAAAACRQGGCAWVGVASRRREQAEELSREIAGVQALPLEAAAVGRLLGGIDLLVNATPLGMQGAGSGRSLVELAPPDGLPEDGAVMDMVYRPPETPLLAAARQAGRRAIPGAGMLLFQGALAFELWTGLAAPVETMAEALARELGVDPSSAGLPRPQGKPDHPRNR